MKRILLFLGVILINTATYAQNRFCFSAPSAVNCFGQSNSVVAGDFNGDGFQDIVVSNLTGDGDYQQSLVVSFGNGTGNFSVPTAATTTMNAGSYSLYKTDLNQDGIPDLLLKTSGVLIRLGNGSGQFTELPQHFSSLSGNAGMVAGDFNGDTSMDVAVCNGSKIVIIHGYNVGSEYGLENTSSEYVIPPLPDGNTLVGNGELVTDDFNGDGKLDFAFLNNESGLYSNSFTVMLHGPQTEQFPFASSYIIPNCDTTRRLMKGDFNNDGKIDLLVAYSDSIVGGFGKVYLGDGDGNFEPVDQVIAFGETGPGGMTFADFDGDGNQDIAMDFSNYLRLYNGDGTGHFTSTNPTFYNFQNNQPYQRSCITTADFNGDGKPDIATSNPGNTTGARQSIILNTLTSVASTIPGSRCGTGTVTLTATGPGTLKWYAAETGGTALAMGASFTTPSISATTTYYVEAANATCTSARTAVVATVNALPSVAATTPAGRCGAGTVTLQATADSGMLNWYAAATGGAVLGTGASFVTPTINATTTYYVEAANTSCSSVRSAVVATVNAIPVITSTTAGNRCGSGSVTLSAVADSGTLSWFASASGGSALGTGSSYATPSISNTTTFYVEAATANCNSVRTPVIAAVNAIPTITSTMPGSRCGTGSVALQAAGSAGALSWYGVAVGGTVLGIGTNFDTPAIATTTTYYVETANGDCTSTRTPVTATVNVVNAPTGAASQTFCAGESVGQLNVVGSNIIWYDSATGGSVVLPNAALVTGTTYYAAQTIGTCESSRLAVNAVLGTCLGTESFAFSNLALYPNPVTDQLHISNKMALTKIEIYSYTGQLLQNLKVQSKETVVDMGRFPSGMYLVKVFADHESSVIKVFRK